MTARGLPALGAAAFLLACAGPVPETSEPAGSVQGPLAVFIAEGTGGTAETQYFLEPPGGARTRLLFARDPALVTGAQISVWGTSAGPDSLFVTGYHLLGSADAVEGRRSALQAGMPLPARSFAFVLLDTGGGVNLTAAQVNRGVFDASYFMVGQGSIRRYYQEASYGLQDITGSVVGPIAFTPKTTCDTTGAAALRATVDAMVGAPSDNYLWYFGSNQVGCNWSGLASLGSPSSPTKDTWYNASANCVVLAQEPGHNFGMQHSSSMKCGTQQAFVDAPDGVCTHSEYGDVFDPMGEGCYHMNAWQKEYQGWLGGCNSVRVSASGTFTLLPLEAKCDGIQSLQIPMPHTRTFSYVSSFSPGTTSDELTYYYVELRSQSAGFDQQLAPQVQIRVGGDYRPRSQVGLHTWLLDMTPSTPTFNDAALAVQQTFTDPAGGVSITATAVSAASATITVTIDNGSGDPVCLDGTALAPPGPATCTGAAAAGTGGAGDVGGAGGDTGSTGGQPPGGAASGGCGCALARGARAPGSWALALATGLVLTRGRRGRTNRRR